MTAARSPWSSVQVVAQVGRGRGGHDAALRQGARRAAGGLVQFAWPDVAERLSFDSEAGMFCAAGSSDDLTQLRATVEPVISSPSAVQEIVARAEAAGFEFDD
jgi:hypothetical protein